MSFETTAQDLGNVAAFAISAIDPATIKAGVVANLDANHDVTAAPAPATPRAGLTAQI